MRRTAIPQAEALFRLHGPFLVDEEGGDTILTAKDGRQISIPSSWIKGRIGTVDLTAEETPERVFVQIGTHPIEFAKPEVTDEGASLETATEVPAPAIEAEAPSPLLDVLSEMKDVTLALKDSLSFLSRLTKGDEAAPPEEPATEPDGTVVTEGPLDDASAVSEVPQ